METIILSLKEVAPVDDLGMDSVAEAKRHGRRRAFDVLMEANEYWSKMDRFRRDRERNKNYCYGDQWNDRICVDGKYVSEEEYIKQQGNVPLKNNLIRRLVRNVLGVYRSQSKEPTCTSRDRDEQSLGEVMSTVLQCNMQLNQMQEMHTRSMEEFLISGFVVHRKWYGWKNEKLDCWTEYVQPNNFFIDCNMRDFRGWDVSCLGEVHDIDFGTLCDRFAKSPADFDRLSRIYSSARDRRNISHVCEEFGYSRLRNFDFLFTSEPTRCRVIEVWRKERKPRYRCHDWGSGELYKIETEDYAEMVEAENAKRLKAAAELGMPAEDVALIEAKWFIDNYWYYYYLTPFGDILDEGETPYAHKSHPYVFKAYPFIDGEIHSFVGDLIDQQRYVNRLITMYDWIMRSSSKGVLLVPEEAVGNMSLEEIADEWSRFNGVIAIKTKNGVPLPQQVASNATNIGISELLQLQLKFFEDISGVHGALQGKQGNSGVSGALYAQQTQNATMSLLDLLDTYSNFVVEGAYKDVRNMQQFYDDRKLVTVSGRSSNRVVYDPETMGDVQFDLSITESTATPVFRQLANDFILEIWRAGQINLEQMLEFVDFPGSEELLQNVRTMREQMEQQQAMAQQAQQMQQLQGGQPVAAQGGQVPMQ